MNHKYKTIDFSKYSAIKAGPVADVLLIEESGRFDGYFIVGAANNLLVTDEYPPLAMLSKKFDYIRLDEMKLVIGAATPTGKIVSFCKKHNIGGFEFLSHLPGTLGGCIKMNAGLKQYETFNSLLSIRTVEGKKNKSDIAHGYRYADIGTIVYEATLECAGTFDTKLVDDFKAMRSNQPKEPSAGSCFKNPPNDYAGRLIEQAGLKGKQIGGMAFSEVHANFLVNKGSGTPKEALELIMLAKEEVYRSTGIILETEIIIL